MAESGPITPWEMGTPVRIPTGADNAAILAEHAKLLRPSDVAKVVQAFNAGFYQLAIEYVWSRAMSALKKQISSLGPKFVGEMLNRPDIDDEASIDLLVTDYDALALANQLGFISATGALELRQSAELISHYLQPDLDEEEELHPTAALNAFRVSIQYILGKEKNEVSMDFASFRSSLTQQIYSADDEAIQKLVLAPYFFRRTAVRLLLTDAKIAKGAQAANALSNLNTVLPLVWLGLHDSDRWQVGEAYADSSATGQRLLNTGLKSALLKVRGFDYVPETLRSSTYRQAATAVLEAHHSLNNYYHEAEPMEALANLGSTIPGPAFSVTMQAALSVKLGNFWGYARSAQRHADRLLKSLSPEQWRIYLSRFLVADELILPKLAQDKPAERWCKVVQEFGLTEGSVNDPRLAKLITAGRKEQVQQVTSTASRIFKSLSENG